MYCSSLSPGHITQPCVDCWKGPSPLLCVWSGQLHRGDRQNSAGFVPSWCSCSLKFCAMKLIWAVVRNQVMCGNCLTTMPVPTFLVLPLLSPALLSSCYCSFHLWSLFCMLTEARIYMPGLKYPGVLVKMYQSGLKGAIKISSMMFDPEVLPLLSCLLFCWGMCISCKKHFKERKGAFW